jgi:alkylhydroperoxidase family enzyme
MANITQGRAALRTRLLEGDGKSDKTARKAAFSPDGGTKIDALLAKVRTSAWKITDEDVAAAKAAGLTEDQIWELVVCAAVGQATRQYEGALIALAAATEGA